MDDLGSTQPRCAVCGAVMRDQVGGWECSVCGHLLDASAELASVDVPTTVDVPSIHGG